jgi:polysaccharide chain length determinant protein (PEP-CTERM system associated)
MLGHRELTFEDYLAMLRRRLWVIVIPTVIGPLVAYGISLGLAERYMSQTLVLVEQQKVPESYVRSVVTDELGQRLGTMQEQILSRTRLQPIIERFNLFKDDVGKVPMEDLVDRLRKAIQVIPVRSVVSTRAGELPGFYISFTASDPKIAQQVCREITSMFMEENLKAREQRAEGTTQFLQKQVENAKAKLDEQDKKLAAFKQRYIGQLPGQEQTNLNILMGLNTQLEAVTTTLGRAQQDKTYIEAQLAQQVAAWEASQRGANPETLEQQLTKAQNDLTALEARYTADHPDVIQARNDVAQLKNRIEQMKADTKDKPADKTEVTSLTEPPQIQQLRTHVHVIEQVIREKTREQERLQQDIKTYQARVQLSPVVEQQYKEITRDYDTALAFYNDLLAKKTQSEMATDLERRQQGEQFKIVDPANLPEKPSYPNRLLFAGCGLVGGLGLGFGIAFLLEMRDKALRNERDIEFYLGVPTLALMPTIGGHASGKRSFLKRGRKVA